MANEPTNEEVMDEVKSIASMMANSLGVEEELEDEESSNAVLSEEELQLLSEKEDLDIFDNVINPRVRSGVMVKHSIWVDGERVASDIKGQGSWAKVHEKYAKNGGSTKIKVVDSKGKFIKQQTQTLGTWISSENSSEEEKSSSRGLSASDFMSLQAQQEEKFNNMMESQRMELKEASKEKIELMTMLMGNKKDDSSLEMMKFMMTMQQQQATAQREEMRRQDELRREDQRRADERFEKLLLNMSSNDDKVDPYEQLKRIQEAEDRGYEKANKFHELLDEKARDRAAEISENTQDDSVTDKAIKSVLSSLPAVASLLSKRSGEQAVFNQDPQKTLPETQVSGGLASETIAVSPQVDQNPNTDKIDEEEVRRERVLKARTTILELTLPKIGEDMLAEVNYRETATKVIEILAENRIPPQLIARLFSEDDFFMIAKEHGIYDIAKASGKENNLTEWIKGFYASVQEETTPSRPRQSV